MKTAFTSDKNDSSEPKIISVKEAESAAYSICQSIWTDEAERLVELIDYKYNQYQIDTLSINELERLDVCSLYTDIRRLMAYFEQKNLEKVYSSPICTCVSRESQKYIHVIGYQNPIHQAQEIEYYFTTKKEADEWWDKNKEEVGIRDAEGNIEVIYFKMVEEEDWTEKQQEYADEHWTELYYLYPDWPGLKGLNEE